MCRMCPEGPRDKDRCTHLALSRLHYFITAVHRWLCGGLFVFNGDEGGLLCGHVKRPLFCGLASGQSWIPRPCFRRFRLDVVVYEV